jgi:hypothetical protein
MIRAVLGFVVGALVWLPAFFLIARAGFFIWPDYATYARTWFNEGVFEFPGPMAAFNVVCWLLAELIAGWVTLAIGRKREAAWVLAAAIALYLGVVHLVLFWPSFPWWYNVAVALLAAPAVLLGATLARGFVRAKALPAVG